MSYTITLSNGNVVNNATYAGNTWQVSEIERLRSDLDYVAMMGGIEL